MPRYVADIEVPLCNHPVVAGNEAVKDIGEEAPLLAADPPHDAEIDRDDRASLGVGEEIARVHVGMEEAVADRVLEEAL